LLFFSLTAFVEYGASLAILTSQTRCFLGEINLYYSFGVHRLHLIKKLTLVGFPCEEKSTSLRN
jgi:hypothetical protein